MAKGKTSSGGKAEATGANYETLAAAWYATRLLLGRTADPICDLPATTRLVTLACQTGEPVDDVNCETSDRGMIFVQAKRSVSLTEGEDTPLGKAIDQFVRQQKAWVEAAGADPGARGLDPSRDRLVLTTRSASSSKIVEILPRLLRGLRDRSAANLLSDVQTSGGERQVADTVERHVRHSWRNHYGTDPNPPEIGSLLRLVWVQTLDVEDGGVDRSAALSLMRAAILDDPTQADAALAELVKQCARFRAERSGADVSTLQTMLARVGIKLKALPDYRADIEALRSWTKTQLRKAPRFTRLLEGAASSTVAREIWPTFSESALTGSFLVVGDPGAGKSGLTYRMGAELNDSGADVVFIPSDVLNVDNLAELHAELRVSRPLAEILQNWPGPGRGVLIVDALDAARKLETQTVLRESIEQVLDAAGGRWNVVASVRKYDLRQGSEWRRAFQGAPLAAEFSDGEFFSVRHLSVGRLTDREIAQTASFSSQLQQLFAQANPGLKELLRNIFNLHLLAELIAQGVVTAELVAIRTQSELLETYWKHRVRRDDGRHDARERVLDFVIRDMIDRRSLRIFRADVWDKVLPDDLVDLERHDILRGEERARGADDDVLLFSHHVLFDYCVARLVFRRGRDPARLVERLKSDRTLTLMVGPSLSMALHDAWDSDPTRVPFWDVALAIAQENLPQAAYLAAPMVAAESATTIGDLTPFLQRLGAAGEGQRAAEHNMHHLIGALLVQHKGGAPLAGQGAGPWMEFAEALSSVGTPAALFAVKPLVAIGTDKPELLTPAQGAAAGAAARRMLEFALSRAPRPDQLIVAGTIAVARTISSDVTASSALLRRLIEPAHLAEFGYAELPWLTRNIPALAKCDLDLVVDIYEAAYGYEDPQADAKTSMGNSAILPLTSNRRQDYQSAWYQLQEAAPALLREFPSEGTRAIARALFGYVAREHPAYSGETRTPETFALGAATARYLADDSHAWYRGGFRSPQDGPALLAKFDAFISALAADSDGAVRLQQIIDVQAAEAGLAAIWASLLAAGAEHPAEFGVVLAPLAAGTPILASDDTRHEAGRFITAVYPILDSAQRSEIERAILALDAERVRKILAGCILEGLAATDEMRALKAALGADPKAPGNIRPFQVTSTWRASGGVDDYLEDEGVSVADPASAALREAMRAVEGLPNNIQGPQITLEVARARVEAIRELRAALEATPKSSVQAVLYEAAEGMLAGAAAHTALAPVHVLNDAEVRCELRAALLLVAKSDDPHFDAAHEESFHENLSWGGQSGRTPAAHGLVCLIRGDREPDSEVLAAIRKLARDPVCHVRLHVVEELHLLHAIDPDWMYAELEHVALNEPTRGVVDGALKAAGRMWGSNPPRFIALFKSVLARYAGQSGVGIEDCRALATSLIGDIYIWSDNDEARQFVAEELTRFPSNSELMKQWIFRHSGNLLLGSAADPADRENAARAKTIGLYRDILNASAAEVDRLCSAHDIRKFDKWSEPDRGLLRQIFGVMDEVALRLYFATGADDAGASPPLTDERARFYREVRPLLETLSGVIAVHVAHYLIQTLEALISIDPAGVFDLIAKSVKASEKGGYTLESMAADVVVRIVERYLADHREVFADPARLNALMDCLDAFVRAGWPAAQALTFRLNEIWR